MRKMWKIEIKKNSTSMNEWICAFRSWNVKWGEEEEKKLQPTHEKKGDAEDFFTTLLPITPHSYNENSTYNEDWSCPL